MEARSLGTITQEKKGDGVAKDHHPGRVGWGT